MNKLKQGTAAIALVASLGLVMPASFGGPASADVSSKRGNQPMTIACNLDGDNDNGYEYESKVNSRDHEFTNNNTEGGERFKFSTLQDLNSHLVFVPRSGDLTSIYTAVKDEGGDTETTEDDTWGDAAIPLPDGSLDPYPIKFEIPPDHPYAYFLGGFSLGKSDKKTNLVDCDVTDVGQANPGDFCYADGDKLVQGDLLDPPVCFQNVYPAGDFEVDPDNVPYCLVDGVSQGECFVEGVFYHYTDIFHIKAEVTGKSSASLLAASADDGGAQSADRPQQSKSKHKNGGGKHRAKGKHRK